MKTLLCVLVLLIGPALHATCEWQNKPVALESAAREYRYLVYEEPDNESFWQVGSERLRSVEDYRSWVRSHRINVDPYALLRRQRAIFAPVFPDMISDFDLILSKKAGTVRDMSCIEKLLFAEHSKTFPVTSVETELRAYILKHPTLGLKIYLGLSRVGNGLPPPFDAIEPMMAADLQKGFRFVYDFHSHPFFFKNPAGDIAGTTIPSAGDALTFRREEKLYGLEGALITNGFNTVEVRADEFALFHPNVLTL